MSIFTKADLKYKDYSWVTTEGDSSKLIGFPDNVLLNRKEGYEITHFINRFIEGETSWRGESDPQKKVLGQKIERMIHDQLPGDVRSHSKVHAWIVANW